jgi:hypothetical protein
MDSENLEESELVQVCMEILASSTPENTPDPNNERYQVLIFI